jgi:hypothetical protein
VEHDTGRVEHRLKGRGEMAADSLHDRIAPIIGDWPSGSNLLDRFPSGGHYEVSGSRIEQGFHERLLEEGSH